MPRRIAMSCTIYTTSCNFAIHATCSLTLMTYKFNELQMFFTIQKLSCKASCKTPFIFIVIWEDDIRSLLDFFTAKGRKMLAQLRIQLSKNVAKGWSMVIPSSFKMKCAEVWLEAKVKKEASSDSHECVAC